MKNPKFFWAMIKEKMEIAIVEDIQKKVDQRSIIFPGYIQSRWQKECPEKNKFPPGITEL